MNLPDPEQAIKMPVEELAGHLVQLHKGGRNFNPHNVMCGVDTNYSGHPKKAEFKEALMEAYGWAYSEGLFILDPEQALNGWMRVSRRGRQLNSPADVSTLAQREILPKAFLHPVIAQCVAPIFHSGRYDSAVYEALKQVEIAVRDATGIDNIGASLMMDAFKKGTGPLSDATADVAEQEGMMFVFAGAMKVFRNSTGHRNVEMDAYQAASLIIHASYLMSIVDERRASIAKSAKATVI